MRGLRIGSSGVAAEAWGFSYETEFDTSQEAGSGPAMAAATYHANSRKSQKPNWGYEIKYKNHNGQWKTFKYGITASKPQTTGKYRGMSNRAIQQMRQLQKRFGANGAKLMPQQTFRNRAQAMRWEVNAVQTALARGQRLPGNIRLRGR
jgi:hypothetical protein